MSKSNITRFALDPVDNGEEPVPAILEVPESTRPVAGVLLLHGFSSRKERMSESIGSRLARRGIASLAVDLPLHGARDGSLEGFSLRNPLAVVQQWRLAVREAMAGLEYLARHPAVDSTRLAIGGYSLGAYLATVVAENNRLVRAVALVAGGDLPAQTPLAALVRSIADPRRAVRNLSGRPLLMVNGRSDQTVRATQATSLFEAAGEPKELRWYNGGHWPPQSAIDGVADWLAERVGTPGSHSRLA